MRSALVTFLIVLYHAAQLPCRSVTRGASLRLPSPSSHEDLDAIIARNREITNLLIPLLEANLDAKKLDQNELLKVFPYQDIKSGKEPVVEFLPFPKGKSRERKRPLALIVASELTSQKGKKGRKVHAQKAFLIQNEDKISRSEEDYDIQINQEPASKKSNEKNNTVEDSEYNKSEEGNDVDIKSELRSNENKHSIEIIDSSGSEEGYVIDAKRKLKEHPNLNKDTVEVNESEEVYDNDIKRQPKVKFLESHVKKIVLPTETQKESGADDDEIVQKKNNKKSNRDYSNVKIVQSNSDEHDDIDSSVNSDDDEVKYHTNLVKHNSINYKIDRRSIEKSDDQVSALERPNENFVDSKQGNNESKQAKLMEHSEHNQKTHKDISSSEEHYKNKSDESYEIKEKYKSKDSNENDSSENIESAIENVSSASKNKSDEKVALKQPSGSAVNNTNEENKTSEDQEEKAVENLYNDHVTNENNIRELDQYTNDSLDVFDYHENVEHGSHTELYDEDEENISKQENNKASYEDILDEENYHYPDAEYENRSKEDYGESDTDYVDTKDDSKVRIPEENSEDDTPILDDGTYTEEWIDNNDDDYNSVESSNDVDNQKQVTISQEIADKYAEDSKYPDEDNLSLIKSSGELGKFNAESVEGLIEVLRQGDEGNKCEEKDIENKHKKEHLSHSHEVMKSYKLSFKFNK